MNKNIKLRLQIQGAFIKHQGNIFEIQKELSLNDEQLPYIKRVVERFREELIDRVYQGISNGFVRIIAEWNKFLNKIQWYQNKCKENQE
jgi:hypothetical protein